MDGWRMVKPLLTNANRFRLCWALLAAATFAACSGTVPSAFHPAGIPTALPTSTPTSTPKPTPTPTGSPPAKIVISPSRLDFTRTGSDAKQPVEVTQTGYPGGFTVKDDCSGIATILPNVNQRGAALFTVTPIAKGSCTATFSGGSSASAPLTIVVQPPGGVTVTPSSLSFTQSGSSAAKSSSVSQKGYDGDFTESDDCGGIASIALTGGSLGAKTYTVTPAGTGTCTADFTGAHNELGQLSISVKLPGSVAVSPDALAFTALGSGAAQDASVSQAGYDGSFSESDTCAGKATFVRTSESAGNATYSVTPVAAGSCTATFTGGNAQTGSLSISIAPYGHVVVAPSAVTFTATGSGAAQTVDVSQSNYAGAFAESDTCGSIATVAAESNEDGKASYRVTPLGRGNCTATFTGGGKASSPLSIAVAPFGNVDVTPATLTFNATGSGNAQHASVSQSGYTGSYTETNDCGTTANVAVTANGSGTAAVTVTPEAAGACSATFAGGNGETGVLQIVVDLPGGVVASPAPLNFALTGSAQGTTVTVTQSGYTGSYTESDTCGRIAKVVQLSNAGGTAQYRVTPSAVGTCSVLFTGGNAETFALAVSVTQTNVVINGSHKP
jgi:hypothetical protein